MFETGFRRVVWILAGVGIAVRLLLPWLPLAFLIEYVVSDDAFYYFTIARNAMQGLGATFDGATPTNGFHPLWLVCLLPIYGTVGDNAELALRLSLTLGALFGGGGILLLGVAVAGWTQDWTAGSLASALFALNPHAIIEGVNGLETSLALLMLSTVLVVLTYWQINEIHCPFRRLASHRSVLLGVTSGALVWARSDMVLVLMGLYAYLLLSRRATVWSLAGAGSVAGVMVALWLAWSWMTVGTPVQSSAVAIPWITRARMVDTIASGHMTQGQVAGRMWQHFAQTTLYHMVNYSGVGLLAGLVGLIDGMVSRVQRTGVLGRRLVTVLSTIPGWLWWGAAGTLGMLLLSEFWRFSLREWYIAPLSLWAAVGGAGLLARWASVRRKQRLLVIMCVVLGFVIGGQIWRDLNRKGRYWFQWDQLIAADWIAARTSEDDVVGSWTAGIYGYFARRSVVNLDGVVNWDAIHAYQARSLYSYMRDRHIRWLVDFDEFVSDFTGFYGADPASFLTPVQVFEDARAPFGRLVVYEVEP
jgi:hypothetical protein